MQAVECVMDDRHLQLRRLRLLDELALTLICDAVDVRLWELDPVACRLQSFIGASRSNSNAGPDLSREGEDTTPVQRVRKPGEIQK
jgi:hypothetical protein